MLDLNALRLATGELEEDVVLGMLDAFIADRPAHDDALLVLDTCQRGMEIVGDRYASGEYYLGDLIFAGELLAKCVDRLKPLLSGGEPVSRGTIVLGTVEGDIHDIGKNIFKNMAQAAGFTVIDLGIDQTPAAFVDAVKESRPLVVGLSGVLISSIASMGRTVEALTRANLRDKVYITIGGTAVSEQACLCMGADAWSKNAAQTVQTCVGWADEGARRKK